MSELRVSEIFASLQGEGIHIGVPQIFIRLAGCNLRCSWCDTKYAWSVGRQMTLDTVVSRVKELTKETGIKEVCITGGEPLMQDITDLVYCLLPSYDISIETNGTIEPPASLLSAGLFWTISPKLANSGMEKYLRPVLVADLIRYDSQLKFVVKNAEDIRDVVKFLESVRKYNPNVVRTPIVLQPMGSPEKDETTLRTKYLFLYQYLWHELTRTAKWKVYNLHLIPQMHVLTFGYKRGV